MASQPKESVARKLLDRAHSPSTAATIYEEKVKHRPLILRPTSPDHTINARSKRQHERLKKQRARVRSKKPKPLSAKQRRALCLDEVPKEQRKYVIFEPLHKMWCEYMQEVLGLPNGRKDSIDTQSVGPFLASADYHGAILEVVRSRCPSRVGLKGIVVKDTKFTFELITRTNELKTVPKEHTLFRFELPLDTTDTASMAKPLIFDILGNQFQTRAPERATRKFRWHVDLDI